jgi:hypothetical protein
MLLQADVSGSAAGFESGSDCAGERLAVECIAVTGRGTRHNVPVRIERSRENVFTVTATSQELSALVAGARMALEAMRSAPEPPPPAAVEILERVLREFDVARERLTAGPPGDG